MSISIEIKDNEQYASVDYWNERYANEEEYDWLGDYDAFKALIHKHVAKSDRILMVGCGNSQLSQQMYADGYENILSTDISEVCIKNQQEAFPHLQWQVADIKHLEQIKDESFDVVIEKATLDALLVGEKSPWHPSDEGLETVDSALREISRVLSFKSGRFLSLTFAQPHFRMPFYAKEKYQWSVDHETFGLGFHYHCFIMTKGQPLQHQVSISSATDISKLTLNFKDPSEIESSSEDDGDFTSKLELGVESDQENDNDDVEPLPKDEEDFTAVNSNKS